MKQYTITVNGNTYDVIVEEKVAGTAPILGQISAPKPAPKPSAKKVRNNEPEGKIKVEAGAAGKVLSIASKSGAKVKKGDTLVIVEAMKMEIPVVAPADGVIATVEISVGDTIESGAVLMTMN